MTILLNQRRGDLDIVNQLADLAVRDYSGHAVLQSLFALCSDRTSITEDLLINAAGNVEVSGHVIQAFTVVYIFDPTLYVSIASSNLLFSLTTPRFRSIFSREKH